MAFIWKALSASVRGDMHEQLGTKNQDSVRSGRALSSGALVIAVADGHGSPRSFRSDRGSELATECARDLWLRLISQPGAESSLSRLRNAVKNRWLPSLIHEWREAVRKDIEAHPFSLLDFAAFPDAPPVPEPGVPLSHFAYLAYGTTLLVVLLTRDHIVYAQIGDGDILTVSSDGTVSRPLVRHHQFFSNVTASICTQQALGDFQVRVDPIRAGGPALVMLSTDGYANCFGNDEAFNQVGADFLAYLRQHGTELVGEKLGEWLHDSSRDGSGDDITVGLAVRATSLSRFRSSGAENA